MENPILAPDDGPAVRIINDKGDSPLVFVCEHASKKIPQAMAQLGASEEATGSHAAWDPGAEAVATHLAKAFDAQLVSAGFSRLVYDLNRPPESPDAMRPKSEIYDIPANENLSDEDKLARVSAIYNPFHEAVSDILDVAQSNNPENAKTAVIATIHSFTPMYFGQRRRTELGILHDNDSRLANEMLMRAPDCTKLKIDRNKPYGPSDGVTHTLKRHALPRGILNVMIEIRSDLVETDKQQRRIAREIEQLLRVALAAFPVKIKENQSSLLALG
ncbi:MAG: N-formylglutamate amidohydrolase [Hyphomicrobiales bacterium]|nr:N-formylglutamate amidohydrolase [Hyphomicrobiales bacterium]PCJ93325.1 MAG: N-formylglutamate amidohydrolase [Hyphomicrobiales bacterium]